ncbi:MAG TPA: (d)CMP kinase [Acidobacteriaceae bacterium]|nr:(d)CMP kinase [Acidobacteriaceae bacterium]
MSERKPLVPHSGAPHSVTPLIVAIDGPAGAGKSTVARALAQRFGLLNIESGAMYRAFALKAITAGVATGDAAALEALAHTTQVRLEPGPEGNRVLLDGADVTGRLRTPQITAAASEVSVHPPIRRWLVGLQQALGAQGNVVMEGRDIGTVVFPRASVKIFLDASPEKRGERRYEQNRGDSRDEQTRGDQQSRGTAVATELPATALPATVLPATVLEEIRERDRRDRTRADSPLRPAPDAAIIDSTDLSLEQVIERAAALVERYLAG